MSRTTVSAREALRGTGPVWQAASVTCLVIDHSLGRRPPIGTGCGECDFYRSRCGRPIPMTAARGGLGRLVRCGKLHRFDPLDGWTEAQKRHFLGVQTCIWSEPKAAVGLMPVSYGL